jgi:NAD(P)-dependent dehydrogenase (short-subunit alcohol dehydrogenase family)
MRGLEHRTTLIVGGAGTIGTRVSRRLAAEGANVAVADLDEAAAAAVAAEIAATGGTAFALRIDVTDETTVVSAIEATKARFGTIDAVHLNAADLSPTVLAADTTATTIDLAVFDRVMAVNLRGHLLCTQHLVPELVARGGGPIVYTSSAGAYMAAPTRVAYSIAKSGLNALVRHVATAYGKQGVRANAVAPGLVLDEANGRTRDPAVLQGLLDRTLSDRLGRPEDAAAMVAFLLSDDAGWINGQILSVDGGLTLRP